MDSGGGFQGRPPGPPERQQMLTEAGAAGDAASHQAQSSRPAVHAAPAASSAAGAAAALAVRKPVPLPTDGSEFVGGARKNSKKRKTEAPLNFYVGVLTAAQDRAFGTTSSMQAAGEKRALSGSAKEKFVIAMQDMVKVVSESESVSE